MSGGCATDNTVKSRGVNYLSFINRINFYNMLKTGLVILWVCVVVLPPALYAESAEKTTAAGLPTLVDFWESWEIWSSPSGEPHFNFTFSVGQNDTSTKFNIHF